MLSTFVRRYSKIFARSLFHTVVRLWSLLDFAIPAKQQQFSLSWMDLLGGWLLLCDLDVGRCRGRTPDPPAFPPAVLGSKA